MLNYDTCKKAARGFLKATKVINIQLWTLLAFNRIQWVFLESIQLTLHLKRAAALGEIIVEPLRYLLMGKKKTLVRI